MNSIRKWVNSHVVISSIFIAAGLMGILTILQIGLSDGLSTYSVLEALGELFCLMLAIALSISLRTFSQCRLNKQTGIINGLKFAWPIYVLTFAMVFKNLISLSVAHVEFQGVSKTIIYLTFLACVALFEEILCRGIILNLLKSKYKAFRALLISSIMFGLCHFYNILGGQNIIITVGQVVYATGLGVVLGIVYLLCINLWPSILVHFVLNIGAMFTKLIYPAVAQTQASITDNIVNALISVAISIPLFVSGIILYKRNKQGL